jgi:hypothetical protein
MPCEFALFGRETQDSFPSRCRRRQHVIERLASELINVLRPMPGDINAKLFHNCDGFRYHQARFCTGALNFEAVACIMIEQPFSHLAVGGIPGTEN